jgi:hypothetical protein
MNYKPLLKAVNALDDVGSAIARKTGSMTIGAAAEGALITGAEGAILGGVAGAIDDDSSVGEGMLKGALIGGAIGGVSQGALSHYLQKNPHINANVAVAVGKTGTEAVSMGNGVAAQVQAQRASTTHIIPEGSVDYARAGQNSFIFGARKGLIKDVSHATTNMRTGETSFANMSDVQVAKWIAEYGV